MAEKQREASIPKVLRRRREKVLISRGYWSLLGKMLLLALALWLLLTKVFFITQVSGNDMFPAVKDGDLILGYRLQLDFSKKDVVVYTAEGKTRVGRILGREGDIIMLDDSGTLLVNGTAQTGEILYPTYAGENGDYPCVVPEKCFFVLSDYRTQCRDSREFGPVDRKNVEAKVITILRRRGI